MGNLLKAMIATSHEEDIDLVILELHKRSFPSLEALKIIELVRGLPYPVLLDPEIDRPTNEPRKRLLWFQPARGETTP